MRQPNETEFAEGLARIGLAVQQKPDRATLGVYFDAIGHQTAAEEWSEFCRRSVEAGRWTWFPKVREILDALREFRGQPPLMAEATKAYDRVLEARNYTAEGGATWDYRNIREACGEAAAEAFLEAGGNGAFSTTWEESKRRERFLAAYAAAVREEPNSRLLPAGPSARVLPGPADGDPNITREEARTLLAKIAGLAS